MALCTRASVSTRSLARPAARVASVKPMTRVVMRSTPDKAAVETAIKEAEEKCASGSSGECAAAWDNVEEISATIAHKKVSDEVTNANDPLEQFCGENPDADECRVYDD